MSAARRGGPGVWVGVGVLVLALVAGVALTGRAQGQVPFALDSTDPAGYAALGELLRARGLEVSAAPISQVLEPSTGAGGAQPETTAALVARPELLSSDELDALRGSGSEVGQRDPALPELVVLAGVVQDDPLGGGSDATLAQLGGRILVDTPALPVEAGACTIVGLDDLGPVDAAFSSPVPVSASARSCYGDPAAALVVTDSSESDAGDGDVPIVTTVAGPLLWANARLQPDKENGGRPLANAALAVALLADVDRVVFVDPVPSAGVTPDGTQDPLSLLPLPVRLALAQLAVAVVIYLWWRARRLGRPPLEELPVEVAGSELVVAIGDLLRRRGSAARSAAALRAEARRVLAARLGARDDLARIVATRTGRDPAEVAAALDGTGAAPVTTDAQLVALARTLETIRQEALREPARP